MTPTPNPSEREKTTAEINQAIAKALGWTKGVLTWATGESFTGWMKDGREKTFRSYPQNYFGDANTRPEMLAALTEEEDVALWELIGRESLKAGKTHYQFTLRLDQPTFAKLFCKVKGLI